ncbi:hypothetical protein BDR04DRAFT_1208651 [Suillus decipiens]|nr:hypothetical protein BDR04DRAFT_1208651 [Suillus decipiens]
MPHFSFCSTLLHHDIRAAVSYGWVEDLPNSDNPPWEERVDERLLWRGTNTGIFHGANTRWRQGHRDHMLDKLYDWRKMQTRQEAGHYKYVFDIDGNGWSGRFKRLMTSNSLVFKSSIYPEWFMDRVAPWVHYVPVQIDLSDLYDTLTFFRGGLQGEGAHEDLAKKIAAAGREWSQIYWRKEDLTAYMFRLFLEYARVSSLDRNAMTYQEDLDSGTA